MKFMLLESIAVFALAMVMAATTPQVQEKTNEHKPQVQEKTNEQRNEQEQQQQQQQAFDPNTTLGKAQIVLEVKDRNAFDALLKATNGQLPLSVVLSTELLESAEGKKIAAVVKNNPQVLTPVLKLEEKKWAKLNADQQVKALTAFFIKAAPAWEKRFGAEVKYVYVQLETPKEVLELLAQGAITVVRYNGTLDQAYASPTPLDAQANTLILYQSTGTKKKDTNLNVKVQNTVQKLAAMGFRFVNADGYFNNISVFTEKEAVEEPIAKANETKEVAAKEAAAKEKETEQIVDKIIKEVATSLNPKEVIAAAGKDVTGGTNVVTLAKVQVPEQPGQQEKKPEVKSATSTGEEKKPEEVKKPEENKKPEDIKQQQQQKQAEEQKKKTAAEKTKKTPETTEEESGISGTTIAIIVVVVVAVIALLAVAYKKMKN